ncbi:DUF4290 domain-containing protein [Roseivirga sp. BDSF3-8]|uniref:DUF4290 domain-containing protein n=1 Tax=Roseivirga sp. BDSF3-8 TaxID=3241598 RepID=UPI003531FBB9
MFEYNTQQSNLILKEYGRNVQRLVKYIKTLEDREKRTRYAYTIIELMKQINPAMQNSPEYAQKLWDDLYIMSGFDLEVDSPYPMPEEEVLGRRPQRVDYNLYNIKYKHYGKNIELLIEEAIKLEDPQEKEQAIIQIGKLMKTFYSAYNSEVSDDKQILIDLRKLSGGKLDLNEELLNKGNLFDSQRNRSHHKNYQRKSGGKQRRRHN